MLTLGILHTTIRADEKLLMAAAKQRGVATRLIDVRTQLFNPSSYQAQCDIALERCVSTTLGSYAVNFFEALHLPVINASAVANICADKFLTSLTLQRAAVPTPAFALVFDLAQAKLAVEQLGGWPVVLKPNVGSWGRLLAKVNDLDALEAIIEHKAVLGSPAHKAIYLQQYINKPGRDIRVFTINGNAICAIYRTSPHWITNTARGGEAMNCPITAELRTIAKQASDAVGGGILAMDVFETADGLLINEINHTMEFKNSEQPTGVNIAGAMIDYCITLSKQL